MFVMQLDSRCKHQPSSRKIPVIHQDQTRAIGMIDPSSTTEFHYTHDFGCIMGAIRDWPLNLAYDILWASLTSCFNGLKLKH